MSTRNGGFLLNIEIGGQRVTFRVLLRPHLQTFLKRVAEWYEVVIFTASVAHYSSPLIDRIDADGIVSRRLYRPSCVQRVEDPTVDEYGVPRQVDDDFNAAEAPRVAYLKDLSCVRPDLNNVIIIDNAPVSYALNPSESHSWYGRGQRARAFLALHVFSTAFLAISSVLTLRIVGLFVWLVGLCWLRPHAP